MSTTAGVGIDLVDVVRFSDVLTRRPTLAGRLFSEREQLESRGRPERLAARFAAKEATWKVLGVGLGATAIRDVEVRRSPTGAPTLHLSGRAAELATRAGVTKWHVSLTHTATSAGAVVVGETA